MTDKEKSFFVGDAAGRKGDHASTDRKFADNIGLPFHTPEVSNTRVKCFTCELPLS